MNFDRILELLFNKVTGIIFAFCALIVATFSMSGCFVYDCSIWTCRTITCDDTKCENCEDTTRIWNDENHRRMTDNAFGIGGLGAFLMTEKEIECTYARIDCMYAEEGCEYDGSCGYIVCGGSNLSCWNTLCEGGLLTNCIKLYSGDLACTCLNCTIYCDGYPDEYIPDSHGKDCSGCDNGPYKPKDYDENLHHPYYGEGYEIMSGGCCAQETPSVGNMIGTAQLYYYNYKDSTWVTYTDISVYEKTFRLPVPKMDGYEFRGYYTESGGKGIKLTDDEGAIINKDALADEEYPNAYARFVPIAEKDAPFTTIVEIYVNGSSSSVYSVETGLDIEELITTNHLALDYGNRAIKITATYEDKTVTIADTSGFAEEYRVFDPADYGITLHSEVVVIHVSEAELMHDVTVHGFDSTEKLELLHKTPISEIAKVDIEGYAFLGYSTVKDSAVDIVDVDMLIETDLELYAIYKRLITVIFDADALGENTEVYYDGETVTMPTLTGIPTGKYLKGWYPADGKLADGSDCEKEFSGEVTVGALLDGVTLVPVFDDVIYKVTYMILGSEYTTDTYKYGETKTLITTVESDFYDFICWTLEDGVTKVTSIDATEHEDKVFYAKVSPRTFYASLMSNGGTISSFMTEIEYGSRAGAYSVEIPSRNGYDFVGWYVQSGEEKLFVTDNNGLSVIDYTVEKLGITTLAELEALKLFAEWAPTTHTLSFYVNGELYLEMPVTHGTAATEPEAPKVPGYTLVCWETNGNLFSFADLIMVDLRLDAVLSPNTYKIVLAVDPTDAYFATVGSGGHTEYGHDKLPAISYVYGTGTVNWFGIAEVYSKNTYATFIGWTYNGVVVIDASGNVNEAALATIPVKEGGEIVLTAMFQ